MVESFSKEHIGKLLVNVALAKLDKWAANEVRHYTFTAKNPLCIPVGKRSWLVGKCRINYTKKKKYAVFLDDRLVHNFSNKQAAFFYAILEKVRSYELSAKLLASDQLYSRLLEQKNLQIKQIEEYKKTPNSFKENLLEAKLSDVEQKLNAASKDLEKNLNSAKYVKVWD